MKLLSIFTTIFFLALPGYASTNTSTGSITSFKPTLNLSQEESWSFMVGKWFGSQPTKEGGVKKQIMERLPQGEYRVTFRIYDKEGKYEEQTEAGYWGISDQIYFTIFRGWINAGQFVPSNPSDPYNYDAYKIISLSNKIFEYKSLSSGNSYSLKKVDNDFAFPE